MSSASRSKWTSLLVGLMLGASVLLPPPLGPRPANAGTVIIVTTTADEFDLSGSGAGCSLREAIRAANSDAAFGGCPAGSGTDTIVLQAGQTYALTTRDNTEYGFTGTPVVQSTIIIEGNGATITRSSGAPSFRLFEVAHQNDPLFVGVVAGAGDLTLRNLTLSGGAAVGGNGGRGAWGGGGGAGMGGAIYVRGTLTVDRSTFRDNLAQGGNGGSFSSTFTGTGGGGGMGGPGGSGSFGSGGGQGGGGGWGGAGGGGAIGADGGGEGGGIIADGVDGSGSTGGSGGSVEGGNGGGSAGGPGATGGGGGGGTQGGAGGPGGGGGGGGTAISDFGGKGGAGGGAGGGFYGGVGGGGDVATLTFGIGGGGGGGASYTEGGWKGFGGLGGGDGGVAAAGAGGGGGAGLGGAIFNDGGTISLTNSTISGNRAVGGTGGSVLGGGPGVGGDGRGMGGAVLNYRGLTIVQASTVASNTAAQGAALEMFSEAAPAALSLARSIVADSAGLYDCKAWQSTVNGSALVSFGSDNLVERNTTFGSGSPACAGVVSSADPGLFPLLVVAPGLTPVHGLGSASPAINAVVGPCTEATDQRGITRPIGPSCDIGAFEFSRADLQLAYSVPTQVTAGTNLVSTLTVTNNGPAWSTDVRVIHFLPLGLAFVSNSGACTTAFPCSLPSMAPGQQATITTTFFVPSNYFGDNPLQSTATVFSLDDPVGSNNSASASTAANYQSDLAITKTDNRTTLQAGQAVAYSIVASNAGPSAASNARIQDTLPASLTGASWVCAGSDGALCAPSGTGNIDTTALLPPGTHVTYSVAATVATSATGNIANTATITAPAGVTDPNPANNSATDVDTIQTCANQHPVAVTTSHGGGALTVVLTAGLGSISAVQFGDPVQHPGGPTDAVIAVTSPAGGPAGIASAQTYTPPPGTSSVTLRITRPSPGPMTVPLVITDGCGSWRTFVGAGAGAAL